MTPWACLTTTTSYTPVYSLLVGFPSHRIIVNLIERTSLQFDNLLRRLFGTI